MRGDKEGGRHAEGQPSDIGRRPGRQNHRNQRPRAELRQHQFHREEDRAEGRVEGGGDPRPRARRDHGDNLPAAQVEQLPQHRPDTRSDLDDRPLAPDRGARTDGHGRGERLDDHHLRPDAAVLVIDRVHHFWHAVALRLGREAAHHPQDNGPADDRGEDHQRPEWRGRRGDIGVVKGRKLTKEKEVVDDGDQVAKRNSAKPGDDTDPDGDEGQRDDRGAPVVGRGIGGVGRQRFVHGTRAMVVTAGRDL